MTSFLHGTAKKDIFMEIPESLNIGNKNLICKLNNGICLFEQSAKLWFEVSEKKLHTQNFQVLSVGPEI